jgi:hypothetical protein
MKMLSANTVNAGVISVTTVKKNIKMAIHRRKLHLESLGQRKLLKSKIGKLL